MIDQSKRDKPKKYLDKAIELFREREGKVIVEIGSMRMAMSHDMDESHYPCCNDGHSSALLSRAADEFFTVDIDLNATRNAQYYLDRLGYGMHSRVINGDGIKFLEEFDKPIDFLYLDAWDVGTPDYAENHLLAYETAKKNLHEKSIISIDDTDIKDENGEMVIDMSGLYGKGLLVIKQALKDGYKIVMQGRQVILAKGI